MKGREPTKRDTEALLEAVAYVNAYGMGSRANNFPELAELLKTEERPLASMIALVQLCWLTLEKFTDDDEARDAALRELAERFVTLCPSE